MWFFASFLFNFSFLILAVWLFTYDESVYEYNYFDPFNFPVAGNF